MSNQMELLHPDLQTKARQLVELCKKQNISIKISQTLRTKAEQDELYAQGRTKPGKIVTRAPYPQSLHCWGVAFDIVVLTSGGKATWAASAYQRVGPIGTAIGLEWGGNWTDFPDYPHYQLPGFSWSDLKKKYGSPQKYIASWADQGPVNVDPTPVPDTVKINIGSKIVEGMITEGRSYGPVRDIAEALGRQVEWDGALNTVLIPPVTVELPAAVKGVLRIAAGGTILTGKLVNGKAYAGVVDLVKALGHTAVWDGPNKTVIVT